MINTVIVDDELRCSSSLQLLLNEYCPGIKVIAIASSVKEAVSAIELHKPQLVFLDVEMPQSDGFSLLVQLKEIPFQVIFTTAYDHYAIQAIRHNAIDYLLKPIDEDELVQAVNKAAERIRTGNNDHDAIGKLIDYLKRDNETTRIAIPNLEGIVFVDLNRIVRFNADSNYTHIHTLDRKKYTVSRTLKEYELLLEHRNFFRVHHAHLINLSFVEKYIKGKGGYVEMADGQIIEVSQKKKNELIRILSL